jgi:hypothetical protein
MSDKPQHHIVGYSSISIYFYNFSTYIYIHIFIPIICPLCLDKAAFLSSSGVSRCRGISWTKPTTRRKTTWTSWHPIYVEPLPASSLPAGLLGVRQWRFYWENQNFSLNMWKFEMGERYGKKTARNEGLQLEKSLNYIVEFRSSYVWVRKGTCLDGIQSDILVNPGPMNPRWLKFGGLPPQSDNLLLTTIQQPGLWIPGCHQTAT